MSVKKVYNYIASLTVAYEYLENIQDYLLENYRLSLNYESLNRQKKKIADKQLEAVKDRIKKNLRDMKRMTDDFVKPGSDFETVNTEIVEKIYNVLED